MYNGKSGNIHGEIKDMMPSKKVMMYCKIESPYKTYLTNYFLIYCEYGNISDRCFRYYSIIFGGGILNIH